MATTPSFFGRAILASFSDEMKKRGLSAEYQKAAQNQLQKRIEELKAQQRAVEENQRVASLGSASAQSQSVALWSATVTQDPYGLQDASTTTTTSVGSGLFDPGQYQQYKLFSWDPQQNWTYQPLGPAIPSGPHTVQMPVKLVEEFTNQYGTFLLDPTNYEISVVATRDAYLIMAKREKMKCEVDALTLSSPASVTLRSGCVLPYAIVFALIQGTWTPLTPVAEQLPLDLEEPVEARARKLVEECFA